MTKTKTQKMRAAATRGQQPKGPVGPKGGKKKRWEFNLIKTGNISGSYMSGNSARSDALMPNRVPTRQRNSALQPGIGRLTQVKSGQIIEQDEFITLVLGSVDTQSTAYSIQPGLGTVFPWGSKVANLYERYSVLDMEFYYKPTVSPYAVGGQQGKVVLSIDYDASEGAPATIQEAESMDPHADCLPYENLSLFVDPARATPMGGKFVRETVIGGTDIKTYDAGNLYVTTAGQLVSPSAKPFIGELRVRYKLALSNPRLTAPTVAPCRCITQFSLSSGVQTCGPMIGWAPLDNPLNIVLAGSIFTLMAGHYVVSMTWYFSTLAAGQSGNQFTVAANRDGLPVGQSGFVTLGGSPASAATAFYQYGSTLTCAFSVGEASGATSQFELIGSVYNTVPLPLPGQYQNMQTNILFHMI